MFTPARQAQLGLFATGVMLFSCMGILGKRAFDRQAESAMRAPAFELADTNGLEVALADLKGKVTVLAFGSIRCPDGSAYTDRMIRLARQHQGMSDLAMYWVNVSDGHNVPSINEIRVHNRVSGQPFPTLLDPAGEVARAFKVTQTPAVVVIDQRGHVRYRGAFDDNLDEKRVRRSYCADVVRTLLGEDRDPMAFTQAFGSVFGPK